MYTRHAGSYFSGYATENNNKTYINVYHNNAAELSQSYQIFEKAEVQRYTELNAVRVVFHWTNVPSVAVQQVLVHPSLACHFPDIMS